MKPTKSRKYCLDCQRSKIFFETKEEAERFIFYNSDEIAIQKGYAPVRCYHCIACNAWHLTSDEHEDTFAQSRTEIVLTKYRDYKERMRAGKQKNGDSLIKDPKQLLGIFVDILHLSTDLQNAYLSSDYDCVCRLADKINEGFQEAMKYAGHAPTKKDIEKFLRRVEREKRSWNGKSKLTAAAIGDLERYYAPMRKKLSLRERELEAMEQHEKKRKELEERELQASLKKQQMKKNRQMLDRLLFRVYDAYNEGDFHAAVKLLQDTSEQYLRLKETVSYSVRNKYETDINILIDLIDNALKQR